MCGFDLLENDHWIAALYGKSGNRCANCKTSLLSRSSQEESKEGRFEYIIDNSISEAGDNKDSNLILLCEKCQASINAHPEFYTPGFLASMKKNHESLVANALSTNHLK